MNEITRFVITDGSVWASDPNAAHLTGIRADAYSWRSEESASTVLSCAKRRANSIITNSFHVEPIKHYEVDNSVDIQMDIDAIQAFIDVLQHYRENRSAIEELAKKYINICVDIDHFIEMSDLNARDGYKLYAAQHENRQKRREYKNRQKIAETLCNMDINIESLKSLVDFLKDPVYKPREIQLDDIL